MRKRIWSAFTSLGFASAAEEELLAFPAGQIFKAPTESISAAKAPLNREKGDANKLLFMLAIEDGRAPPRSWSNEFEEKSDCIIWEDLKHELRFPWFLLLFLSIDCNCSRDGEDGREKAFTHWIARAAATTTAHILQLMSNHD